MVWLVTHAPSYVLVCVHSVPLQDGLSDETHESAGAPEAGAKLEADLDDEADAKESLTKRAKPASVTAPAPAWLWPGVQPRMAQSMELALAQNTQNAQNAMQ